jgi:hypothetical protein
MLQIDPASFDKLRLRTFLYGLWKMPLSLLLILSLSKDAGWFCSPVFRHSERSPYFFMPTLLLTKASV